MALAKLFYPISEATEIVSIGRTRLYEAIKTGELRSIKVGRSRLIPAEALIEYARRLEGESR